MFTLKISSDDPAMIELAKDYWDINADGTWKHTVEMLRLKYNLPKGRVQSMVAKACSASRFDITCPSCGEPCVLTSRAQYADLARRSQFPIDSFMRKAMICEECLQREAVLEFAEFTEQERLKEAAIINWLSITDLEKQPISYTTASAMDAFLLDGLLRYASDAWQGSRLEPWNKHRMRLCPHIDDTIKVFQQLYQHGWITPSPESALDAFEVDPEGNVGFKALEVTWEISPDIDGTPFSSLIDVTDAILRQATKDEIYEIWCRVSLAELREHFLQQHESYRFRSKGWTPAIEDGLLRLLEDCSLGIGKAIIKKTFHNLAGLLQNRTYTAPHVYNMLPGNFQRTFNYFSAQGWAIQPVKRPWHTQEAIYTGHLFDRILGGGTNDYNNMTGLMLKKGPDSSVPAI